MRLPPSALPPELLGRLVELGRGREVEEHVSWAREDLFHPWPLIPLGVVIGGFSVAFLAFAGSFSANGLSFSRDRLLEPLTLAVLAPAVFLASYLLVAGLAGTVARRRSRLRPVSVLTPDLLV